MNMILKNVFLLFFLLGNHLTAFAGENRALLDVLREPETIMKTLDQEGSVRVIVEFSAPQAPALGARDSREEDLSLQRESVKALQHRVLDRLGVASGRLRTLVEPRHHLRLLELSPLMAMTVNAAELAQLAADPEVVKIHPDRKGKAFLQNSVPLIGMTGAGGAYALGATGSGQSVAILDTGVQSSHPFLKDKVVAEACFSGGGDPATTLCPNGQLTQQGPGAADVLTPQCQVGGMVFCWHGTHVAGIAAGSNPQPTIPPNGVAKASHVIAVQVFSGEKGCTDLGCLYYVDSDVIAALEWLYGQIVSGGLQEPVAALNMSFGFGVNQEPCDQDPMAPILGKLRAKGVAPVAAAGNSALRNALSAPACISSVIAVGATTINDLMAPFSNQSPMVGLLAPGVSILSSMPVSTYAAKSGTSQATPHVVGAIAALRSLYPDATVDRLLGSLRTTGIPITGSQIKPRIAVANAISAMPKAWSSIELTTKGAGLVASQPDGIYCNTRCTADFLATTALTLTATPQRSNRFDGWSGDCSGKNLTCTLNLTGRHQVQATFVPTVVVGIRNFGGGVISSVPSGIDCGSACQGTYDVGTPITLTAKANSGYVFKGWGGACTGSALTCQLKGDADAYVTAEFIKQQTLTVTLTGSGRVVSTPSGIDCGTRCTASVAPGTSMILNALADPGWRFSGWMGDCSGTGNCSLMLDVDRSVGAGFFQLPTYPLEIQRPTTGIITSQPSGILCGGKERACSGSFSDVALSAVPDPGFGFKAWTNCPSSTAVCTTTLTAASRIGVLFKRIPDNLLVVQKTRGGSVTSSPRGLSCSSRARVCRHPFRAGTALVLNAKADRGRVFAGWGGACAGQGVTCEILMNQAQDVTAAFQ